MISANDLHIDELAQIFILANTPNYLYKLFSSDLSINKLAKDYSSEDLINIFREISRKEITTFEDVVLFYSVILALTKKPYEDVREFFKELNGLSLRWAKQISEIYFSKIIPESLISYEYKYQPPSFFNKYLNSSNTNYVDYQKKPKIIVER